jgi:hypothetical protein
MLSSASYLSYAKESFKNKIKNLRRYWIGIERIKKNSFLVHK